MAETVDTVKALLLNITIFENPCKRLSNQNRKNSFF